MAGYSFYPAIDSRAYRLARVLVNHRRIQVGLVDQHGRPLQTEQYKKAKSPPTGEAFGAWAGRDLTHASLPGGGVVQFDLSKLTLADFRAMRDNYQINASLSVLSFMQHQSEWHIECADKKIAEFCEENLKEMWSPLCKSLGTANWAGFSPNVLQWENDTNNNSLRLTKIKDLIPEECAVHWKTVEGWAPPGSPKPKIKIYDGIKQATNVHPIPVDNTFWYPILMENGDHWGRKLLRPAFQSWFFSILMHLFANRYYERFGEPTPIGRAPFEEELSLGEDTPTVRGNTYMLEVLKQLRSRSVVVLPNERTDMGNGRSEYDYDIEYLESQMRGADFERYMTRLDEEMSLGIFTPILLMRAADVGSYSLGVGHMQLYLWMLNALNDDRAQYINKFILERMKAFNFSEKAPKVEIKFRKMGNDNMEMVRSLLTELVRGDKVTPDLTELGQMAGLSLKQISILSPDSKADPEADTRTGRTNPAQDKGTGPKKTGDAKTTGKKISARIRPQVEGAFRNNKFNSDLKLTMGYQRQLEEVLADAGFTDAFQMTRDFYSNMDKWIEQVIRYGDEIDPEMFMAMFDNQIDMEITRLSYAPF
jgi:hypothetical protein